LNTIFFRIYNHNNHNNQKTYYKMKLGLTTTLQQIETDMDMDMDEYFIRFKNQLIANAVKFIKKSYKQGDGKVFIEGEKDNLRKIISCNSIEELLVVEKNLLDNVITTNLTSIGKNSLKLRAKTNDVKHRLRRKLIEKSYGK